MTWGIITTSMGTPIKILYDKTFVGGGLGT